MVILVLLGGSAQADDLSVIDGMGREVRFDKTPQTCVSLTPANTEILFALGLGDKLIGVDNQSDYPPEAQNIAHKIGDYFAPSIEAIVALRPDVVFASDKLQKEIIDQLTALGLCVICNDPTSLDAVIPGIELIAQVMDADASTVTDKILAAKDAVETKVYFALSFGEYGNYTAGPGTFIDDMIALCRGYNVAGNMPVPWPEYSMEQLVLDDPDLIIVSDYIGDGSLVKQLSETPGYASLRCVKEGRVYAVDANITSRPGPRIAEAIAEFERVMRQASIYAD